MSFISGIFSRKPDITTEEKKAFEQTKNALANSIHEQALVWFDNATVALPPNQTFSKTEGIVPCLKRNLKTEEDIILYVDGNAIKENIPVNYDEIIKNLTKEEKIVFNFLLNTQIKDYSKKELEVPADVIKTIENIKHIKDSTLLKVAALTVLQDVPLELLDKKYSKLWL